MTKKSKIFLVIIFLWTWLIGAVMHFANIDLSSIQGIILIAVLYMPSPLVAALIAEKGLVKSRIKVPYLRSKQMVVFLLAPVLAIVLFTALYFAVIYLLGNVLQVPVFGHIATTSVEIMKGAADLVGQQAVNEAGTPPPPIVLIVASVWGAIVAGWTINALFAMGEEYGWRGLLWEEFKEKGFLKANIIIGSIWGLWHAPLILQGYNYPGRPLLGIFLMVLFAIGFSFVLSALTTRTNSVWPAAAAHGMFNALAVLLLMFLVDANALIMGPLGLIGALLFSVIGLIMWTRSDLNIVTTK
jgi:membrane protease YdiL (CAAX protease family)